MINQIFLDLDDVCNTLAMYALHVQGIDISPTDYSEYPVECGYDVVAAANLLGQGYCTVASFWDAITESIGQVYLSLQSSLGFLTPARIL